MDTVLIPKGNLGKREREREIEKEREKKRWVEKNREKELGYGKLSDPGGTGIMIKL